MEPTEHLTVKQPANGAEVIREWIEHDLDDSESSKIITFCPAEHVEGLVERIDELVATDRSTLTTKLIEAVEAERVTNLSGIIQEIMNVHNDTVDACLAAIRRVMEKTTHG